MSPEKTDFFAIQGHRLIGVRFSGFVLAQIGDAGDVNFFAFNDNQAEVSEFMQDAREMFLREIEAGGNGALVAGEGEDDVAAVVFAFREFAQQIADDALFAGV